MNKGRPWKASAPAYALGHSQGELQRLIRQSALFAEISEQLLRDAGICEGMRVLDVGCGAGCVSMMAARLVGSAGKVIGMDKSPDALKLARQRADEAHLHQLSYLQADIECLQCGEMFDAVIGRCVLMFLTDPVAVLRRLATHVSRNGIIAFQELDIAAAKHVPDMPIWRQCGDWIVETFRRTRVDIQMGLRLHELFLQAGLPAPNMKMCARVGGLPELPAHEYLASVISSLLPTMETLGIASLAEVGLETLAARLEEEMHREEGVSVLPPIIGAWSRLAIH